MAAVNYYLGICLIYWKIVDARAAQLKNEQPQRVSFNVVKQSWNVMTTRTVLSFYQLSKWLKHECCFLVFQYCNETTVKAMDAHQVFHEIVRIFLILNTPRLNFLISQRIWILSTAKVYKRNCMEVFRYDYILNELHSLK